VCRQILPFGDDDDALGLLRQQLASAPPIIEAFTAIRAAPFTAIARPALSDEFGVSWKFPFIDVYTLRGPNTPFNAHATKRPIARRNADLADERLSV